jgi:phosphonate transport system substrate-binding protein
MIYAKSKFFIMFFLLLLFIQNIYADTITFTFTGTTLKEDLKIYLKWKKYLESNSIYKINIKFARTYAEAISDIKESKSDIAYVCGSTYTILKDNESAKLLAIPIVNNKDQYYSYIISLKGRDYNNLLDFKDKIFAFTDIDSTSGSIAPTYYLLKHNFHVNYFFKKLIYTYDHGESIEAVLDGFVNGASIDSLVYEQYITKHPKASKQLKIVQKIGPFTISPIIINSSIGRKKFLLLQKLFLKMDSSDNGKDILNHLHIDRFVKPIDQKYKKIYEMTKYIKEKQ